MGRREKIGVWDGGGGGIRRITSKILTCLGQGNDHTHTYLQ